MDLISQDQMEEVVMIKGSPDEEWLEQAQI